MSLASHELLRMQNTLGLKYEKETTIIVPILIKRSKELIPFFWFLGWMNPKKESSSIVM